MTWLFTQVWLWSSAAFVVGSLLTWLLFVRPLRKQLRRYEDELPVYDVEDSERQEPSTAIELLPNGSKEEPEIGDWERRPRSRNPRPLEAASETRVSRAERPERAIPDWTDDGDTREVERLPQDSPAERDVPGRAYVDEQPEPRMPMLVDAPRMKRSTPEQEKAERPASGGSTWFQKPDIDEQGWSGDVSSAEAPPEPSATPSSSVESLFEPLGNPDPDAVRVEALNLDATQNIPRIEEPSADAEQTPLPRRTPGAGPRPGLQNLGAAAAERLRQHTEQQSTQHASGPGPEEGYTIKGHFASRQYHTPDSPQYERISAEVWFRTTEDAEQAGFEAWNARN